MPKALNSLARRNTPGWERKNPNRARHVPTLKGFDTNGMDGTLSGLKIYFGKL
jgi:hypothetical protein